MNCGRFHHLEEQQNISNYFPFLYVKDNDSCILCVLTVILCMIGLVGNGIVLWFLCSSVRRNSSVFITNLAVADFGVLSGLCTNVLLFFVVKQHGQANYGIYIVHLCFHNVYVWMHYSSANFLMIISIDRCVAVLYPIWHRCHRSKFLLATTSAFLWALSFLMAALSFFFRFCYEDLTSNVVSFTVIYVIVVFSTGVLSLKVCCSSYLRQRGKLLVAILISLFFFIVTMVPRGLLSKELQDKKMMPLFFLFLKSINSSVNPIIYFFVGILKAGPAKKTLKAVFQRFFKEDDYTGGEGDTPTNLSAFGPASSTTTSNNCAQPSVSSEVHSSSKLKTENSRHFV